MEPIRFAAATLAIVAAAGAAPAQCDVYRLAMPDFDQRRSAFPNEGRMYCVPTATANALAYISNHGFPKPMDGPRDWARKDAAMYDFVSANIIALAFAMGTSPTNGTSGGAWLDGLSGYLHDVRKEDGMLLVSVDAAGYSSVHPHQLSNFMKNGGIVLPRIGWYDGVSLDHWERTGGHLVTMWGGFDICSGGMVLAYCDPANDRQLTGQSDFATTFSDLLPTFANFRYAGSPYFRRIQWRFPGSMGFLDGFRGIMPVFGLTTGPTLADISFGQPQQFSADPPRPRVTFPVEPDTPILDVAQALIPTAAFLLTAPGRLDDGRLWLVDSVEQTKVSVAKFVEPHAMETGRDGTVYVADGRSIVRYGLNEGGQYVRLKSETLPAPGDDLFYDDAADELLILHIADRRLLRFGRDLDARSNDLIPAGIPLAAGSSVVVNPVDGAEWFASPDVPALYKTRRDPVSGRLVLDATTLIPGVEEPHAAQFDDLGRLVLVDRGVIREFELDSRGRWQQRAGLFDGQPSGKVFRIGRSRSNWDQATMGGVDDINILPPDMGPGTPHCVADMNVDGVLDFFDFLEFQDLFAAGSTHADLTFDGVLDFFDFLAFQDAFAAGC